MGTRNSGSPRCSGPSQVFGNTNWKLTKATVTVWLLDAKKEKQKIDVTVQGI